MCCNGQITAIWQYDKRPVNGAAFVYFGYSLVDPKLPLCSSLLSYAGSVLDALKIDHGPSHMEVMMTPTGPCLVEVGARCHGAEGYWLGVAEECVGYTQVSVTVDAYLTGKLFDSIDPNVFPMHKVSAVLYVCDFMLLVC